MARQLRLVLILAMLLQAVSEAAAARRIPVLMNQEDWFVEVTKRGVDPEKVLNPIEITDEMREVARRVAGSGSERQQLSQLQAYLFNDSEFRFTYAADSTLTARQAFEQRSGNCVAFTNLFIAMARSLGIKVLPALVYRLGKPEVEGDLIIIRNHIVAAHRHSNITTVYDFYRYRENALIGFHFIDDLWNTAVYLNNMGARALRSGENENALFLFDAAVRLAPEFTAAYGNLGVARRRTGDPDGAFEAYARALRKNNLNTTLRANLFNLLNVELDGKLEKAGLTREAVENGNDHLLLRAHMYLAARNLKGARKFYNMAAEADPGSASPMLGLTRLEIIRGKLHRARSFLGRALEIDGNSSEAAVLQRTLDVMFQDKERN